MNRERYHEHVFHDMVSNQYIIVTFDAEKKTWNIPAWQTECRGDEGAKIAYLKGKVEVYEKLLKDKRLIRGKENEQI